MYVRASTRSKSRSKLSQSNRVQIIVAIIAALGAIIAAVVAGILSIVGNRSQDTPSSGLGASVPTSSHILQPHPHITRPL